MNVTLISSLITAGVTVVIAVLTYWFTKKREIQADLRKDRLGYYKALIESFSGIIENESTPEGQEAFSRASNNLLLFAPQYVIQAFDDYRKAIRIDNIGDNQGELLTKLLNAIRCDLGIAPYHSSFTARLWSSGIRKTQG